MPSQLQASCQDSSSVVKCYYSYKEIDNEGGSAVASATILKNTDGASYHTQPRRAYLRSGGVQTGTDPQLFYNSGQPECIRVIRHVQKSSNEELIS